MELSNIGWITGKINAADVLKKGVLLRNTAMWNLVTSNKVDLEPDGCAVKEVSTQRNR